jgi:hypothetical protein
MVTSIHLLFLLSAHRNEEFYSKIETLNSSDLKDQHISYVLLLNDAIEEGSRVFNFRQLQKSVPTQEGDSFSLFQSLPEQDFGDSPL